MKCKSKNFKFSTLLISLLVICGFSSCDSDGYSLNDVYGSVVTVHTYPNGEAEYFTTDNGTTLYVVASDTKYKPENERAYINYTILSDNYNKYDHAIKLNYYFEDILTKPIIYIPTDDKVKQDSIGYDQIKVVSIYAREGYITIKFAINVGGSDSHRINLVALDRNKEQQGDKPIKLEFRHNKCDDEELYGAKPAHVSFKIDDYIKANEGKSKLKFEVSWQEYSGEDKSVVLEYSLIQD